MLWCGTICALESLHVNYTYYMRDMYLIEPMFHYHRDIDFLCTVCGWFWRSFERKNSLYSHYITNCDYLIGQTAIAHPQRRERRTSSLLQSGRERNWIEFWCGSLAAAVDPVIVWGVSSTHHVFCQASDHMQRGSHPRRCKEPQDGRRLRLHPHSSP